MVMLQNPLGLFFAALVLLMSKSFDNGTGRLFSLVRPVSVLIFRLRQDPDSIFVIDVTGTAPDSCRSNNIPFTIRSAKNTNGRVRRYGNRHTASHPGVCSDQLMG